MTQLNLNDARCEALFASGLQRSERPTARAVAEAISRAVRQFGIRGCASRMAQEFGDHPQAAAERMRWARLVVAEMTARPQPSPSRIASLPPRCGWADGARSATRSAVAGRGRNATSKSAAPQVRRPGPDTPPGTPGRGQEIGGTHERDM